MSSRNPPRKSMTNNTKTTTTRKANNHNMATDSDQILVANNKNNNFSSSDLAEGSQPTELTPGLPKSGAYIYSQLVFDRLNNPKKATESKFTTTTTTTTNNNISNITNSSSSGGGINSVSSSSSSTSKKKNSCANFSCTNSVFATVTKVVTSSDEEQEAFLAEIDSDLPNLLSRTFMGQDARFSFILFFTVFSFSLVLGLFVIQASYAWHNYQLLEMLGREDFSEEFFYLHYYDPPEPLTDDAPSPGLRVNTSFYVH